LYCKKEGVNNLCNETTIPGFYIDENKNYIECFSNYQCKIISLENSCNDNNVGKLVNQDDNKIGLCLSFPKYDITADYVATNKDSIEEEEDIELPEVKKYIVLEFKKTSSHRRENNNSQGGTDNSESIDNYLIKHVKNKVFSFDKSAIYYAVKVDTNSITFNNDFTTGKMN